MDQQIHNDSYVSEWMDSSGNQRHAFSDFVEAPVLSYDLNTERKILSLDYGKKLIIPDAVSMPITLLIYGRETGLRFFDREYFTNEGWRLSNNNSWVLRRWDNNNPALNSNLNSTNLSVVCWTISRYGYELRVNGEQILTNSSGNWNPDALFDRINGDSSMEIGELLLFPRALENSEKESMEGYLGHKWAMMSFFPSSHPYPTKNQLGNPDWYLTAR